MAWVIEMESNHFDVVVVGAGLSGIIAASVAARQKRKVALVATGPGSFVLSSGCLRTKDISRASAAPELGEAVSLFCEMARLAGSPYEGEISAVRFLPTILGDYQKVAFAPPLLWNAEPCSGVATAIVGISGLSSFDENFMAERLHDKSRAITSGCIYTARRISLSRDRENPLTTLRIAQCFDGSAGFRAELIAALHTAAQGCARILVPGVLGISSSAEDISQLESEVGCVIGELPTLPPSISGLRLFHSLESYLKKIGVELWRGFPVEKIEIHNELCTEVHIASPGHAMRLRGDSVVLAAGRSSAHLLGEAYTGRDKQMRPLTAAGALMAENLFVAGTLLTNGLGDCGNVMQIVTGYCAGNLAASTRGSYAAG
jgi:glycerol-3-phosphate dehydrogenase subunit B